MPADISPLDTKFFSDPGAESDDSGFHSYTDINFFSGRRGIIDEDYMENTVYNMDVNNAGDNNFDEDNGDENSDGDSDSSSGSSDDDDDESGSSSGSSDDMDDDDEKGKANFRILF